LAEAKEIKKWIIRLVLAIIVFLILIVLFEFNNGYIFYLDGEKVKSLLECEDDWHYENISSLPCVFNETLSPIFLVNISLSPEENCKIWNGTFVGFNIKNETRAKYLYELVMPKCWEITKENITEEYLKSFDCIEYKSNKCKKWQKNNLIIKKN
jgi:hypothetical protein